MTSAERAAYDLVSLQSKILTEDKLKLAFLVEVLNSLKKLRYFT